MTASNDDLHFQYYLVCFLDHVGQRKALRDLKKLPKNDIEFKVFIEAVRESFGRVIFIREAFNDYFEKANSHTPNIDLVSPELQEEFIASFKSKLYMYGMSDSIVIAVPLANENENCTPMNGVWSTFVAACGVLLICLSGKVVLRGGLDVGIAAKIEENEIYGPALERAYYNESQSAEYPRLITGVNLIEYIHQISNQECRSQFGWSAPL